MDYYADKAIANLGTLDTSGANTIVFAPGRPADVCRAILVNTVAHTVADAIITVAVRDVDNGNSTTIGTFTLPFTGSAADDVKYVELVFPDSDGEISSIDGSLTFSSESPGGPIQVDVGQEISFTSNGGGDAGTYQVYVEYYDQPFQSEAGRVGNAAELTFTPA